MTSIIQEDLSLIQHLELTSKEHLKGQLEMSMTRSKDGCNKWTKEETILKMEFLDYSKYVKLENKLGLFNCRLHMEEKVNTEDW